MARHFFERGAVELARALIGCVLVHETPEGTTAGRIVETEAYDQGEPASHSHRGPTPRNQVMFGPAGFAYVYFSYGMHWCMNVVAGREGRGAAVLLRALEPVDGLALMAQRRGLALDAAGLRRLCRGPGCLTQAMGIDQRCYGADLAAGPLRVLLPEAPSRRRIAAGPRIGISKAQELPWRFVLADNPFVSGRRA